MTVVDRAPPWLRALHDADAVRDVPKEIVWNLRGMDAWWREYPGAMDFLAEGAENRALKALETRMYREALRGVYPAPNSPPLRVLDAACGIGRFALPLARAGHTVDGVDACRASLDAAARHGAAVSGVRWFHGDVRDLDAVLPAGRYDLALAFELLCYLPDPAATVAQIAKRLKPGGRLIGSVEAWPGALLSDPTGVRPETLAEVLATRTIAEPDQRWVRASDPPDLGAILREGGLLPQAIVGTHYLPDGPLAAMLDHQRIGDPSYDDAICEAERVLRENPEIGGLPRAWLIVAERPR